MTKHTKGYLLMIVSAVLSSTTEVALKAIGDAFSPMQVSFERVLIGAIVLLPFALRSIREKKIRFDQSDWLFLAMLGFLTVPLHMAFQQMAIIRMDASAAATIYSGNPVFAIIIAYFVLHEPLRKNHIFAILLELIGILFLLNPARLELDPIGFIEIICATAIIAFYNTLCKLRMNRLSGTVLAVFSMLFGSLELFVILMLGRVSGVAELMNRCGLAAFANVSLLHGFTLRSTLLLIYVGVFCAGIGLLLTTKITEYTSATEASFTFLVRPILATAVAAWVLNETISTNRMIGIAFFVASSACVIIPKLKDVSRERSRK